MGFSGPNINKFLYFLNRKILLHFGKPTSRKKVLIFQETETSYISGNRHPKKLLIFQEVTFRAQKKQKNLSREKFLIFQETDTLKNSLCFRK